MQLDILLLRVQVIGENVVQHRIKLHNRHWDRLALSSAENLCDMRLRQWIRALDSA